jgi:hypothetical protein
MGKLVEPVLIIEVADGTKFQKTMPKVDEIHARNSVYTALSIAKKDDFILVDGDQLVRYSIIYGITITTKEVENP